VWWDTALRSGEAYDKVTEAALRSAKVVVVLWSPRSVESRWVRAEATIADRNKTLMPVTIEPCERPVMFELTQTADLTHWSGAPDDPEWRGFLGDVMHFIGRELPADRKTASTPIRSSQAARGRPGLAIVPFQCGDADEEFAQDLASETATVFSRYQYILNFQPQSAGARYLLEGALRRSGERSRLTARLIEVQTGEQIWAERIDAEGDDPFAVQEDMANQLARKTVIVIELAEMRWALARPEEARGAYYGLIAGLHAFRTFSIPSHRRAVGIIETALVDAREDPYLLTMASMCCSALLLLHEPVDREQLRLTAQDYSRRALLTGEDDPFVLGSLAWAGILFGGDTAILDTMAERALARNPGSSTAWGMSGQVKMAIGDIGLTIQRFEKALELEPRAQDRWGIFNMLGCAMVLDGQYEAALVPLKEALQMVPGAPYISLGLLAAYVHLGRMDEAREMRKNLHANDAEVDLDLFRSPAHRAFFRDALARVGQ
jgi:TolB-like protein